MILPSPSKTMEKQMTILTRKELTEKLRIIEKELRDIKTFHLERIEIELMRLKQDLNNAPI